LDLLEKTRDASSAGGAAGVATARKAPTAVSGVNVAAASGIAANDSAPSRHWIGGVSTETGPHAGAGAPGSLPESPAPSTDNNPGVDFLTPELWQGLTAWLSDSPLEMLRRHSTDPRPTGTMHQNILNDVRAHASAHSYRSTRANCFMTPSGFGCFPTLRERVRTFWCAHLLYEAVPLPWAELPCSCVRVGLPTHRSLWRHPVFCGGQATIQQVDPTLPAL